MKIELEVDKTTATRLRELMEQQIEKAEALGYTEEFKPTEKTIAAIALYEGIRVLEMLNLEPARHRRKG